MIGSVLYYTFAVVFLTLYGIFISLVWLFTVWFDKRRAAIAWTTRYHAMGMFWLNFRWKFDITGMEHIDRKKAYVVVSNHQAMFDIPLLHALKINMRWVAKRELIKMPFVGHAMLVHGDILIERGTAGSAKKMFSLAVKELKRNVSVAIFPEGTRSRGGKMRPFKEGAFRLAKMAGTEILPVAIEGTATAFDGWKLVSPHTFYIRVLKPVDAETVKNCEAGALAHRVHDRIMAEHRKLRPDLYDN